MSQAPIRARLASACSLALAACAQERPFEVALPCPSWAAASSVLASRCASCHGPARSEGDYRLDSYAGATARRPDASQRLAPGDPQSQVLLAAQGQLSGHPATDTTDDDLATLTGWIVDCRVAYADSRIHDSGWMNPGDAQFHGLALRSVAYAVARCERCHGNDATGGPSGVSCASCHPRGVFDCRTCHGDDSSAAPPRDLSGHSLTSAPGVGAHRLHLADGALHQAYPCQACHVVPASATDQGHYQRGVQPMTSPAPVTLSDGQGQHASYDVIERRCSGTWCHSPSIDTSAQNPAPRWNAVGEGEAACGSCHGLPPALPHPPDTRCQACHPRDFAGGVLSPALHTDGVVEVDNGAGGCGGCHGSARNNAPPRDVLGRTDASLPSVGAHQSHLTAEHRLRPPLGCAECHQLPAQRDDPGHIDHPPPAIVFPASPGVGALASADGAAPSYDPTTHTCRSVYCHGGGVSLSADMSPAVIRLPSWTGGEAQIACGSCHGVPPRDGQHLASLAPTDCAQCHRPSIDPTGALVVGTDPSSGLLVSTHLDGKVTLGATP